MLTSTLLKYKKQVVRSAKNTNFSKVNVLIFNSRLHRKKKATKPTEIQEGSPSILYIMRKNISFHVKKKALFL